MTIKLKNFQHSSKNVTTLFSSTRVLFFNQHFLEAFSNIFQKCSNIFKFLRNVGFVNYFFQHFVKYCNIFVKMLDNIFLNFSEACSNIFQKCYNIFKNCWFR
jgi:hypothetical protein